MKRLLNLIVKVWENEKFHNQLKGWYGEEGLIYTEIQSKSDLWVKVEDILDQVYYFENLLTFTTSVFQFLIEKNCSL